MTPEQQQYFDDLGFLFVHPGWAKFEETFKDYKQALTDQAYSHKTMEEYFYAKGRMDCFEQVLGFRHLIADLQESAQQQALEDTDHNA